MLLTTVTTVALALTVSAAKLFVSSYTGNITTLELTQSKGTYSLTQIQVSRGCAPNSSWLELDKKHGNLYCVDENFAGPNGSLHSFKVNQESGALKEVNCADIPLAPVHSTIYTNPKGAQLLAVAHYAWALTTYKLSPNGDFIPFEHFNFTMDKPGPDAARQAAPHPHQVIVDLRNEYLVVPDLGADIVRIFYIDPITLQVSARPPIPLPPRSGPRHGKFVSHASDENGTQGQAYYYYLVTELSNTLFGYRVNYLPKSGGLSFTQIASSKTYGTNKAPVFAGNAASEIVIAPDNRSLLVSNRNATFFEIANPDPKNSTRIASDTLAKFSFDLDGKGGFKFDALSPAGGLFPRHFRLNGDGSLVAVGLQNSGRVAIYQRDKETGKLGDTVLATFEGLGGVTSIIWVD